MTIGELKSRIADIPNDYPVFVEKVSFRYTDLQEVFAAKVDERKPDSDSETIKCFVISHVLD